MNVPELVADLTIVVVLIAITPMLFRLGKMAETRFQSEPASANL